MNKYTVKKTLLASLMAVMLSNPEKVFAEENLMDQYLEEELKFYKEHPETMEKDAKKHEMLLILEVKHIENVSHKALKMLKMNLLI